MNSTGRTLRELPTWIEWAGRIGFAAIGIVYVLVGVLALETALGVGAEYPGFKGAFLKIEGEPFGRVLLVVVGIGLACYAAWQLIATVTDPYRRGTDFKGTVSRAGYVISGFSYGALSYAAFSLAGGGGGGGAAARTQQEAAGAMTHPLGRWLVVGVGLGMIGLAVAQFVVAAMAEFMKGYRRSTMGARTTAWVRRIGRFGFAARGVVFGIIGGFLVNAGLAENPQKAKGLPGALRSLARSPYGPWLLGAVAAGLIAFGVYCLSGAVYRRFTARGR